MTQNDNLKATELRIGNYVNYQDKTVKINSTGRIYLSHKHNKDYVSHKIKVNSYEPIPLTEEWLIKFGFEKEAIFNASRFILKGYFIVTMHKRGVINFTLFNNQFSVTIKHVHQLQNLYFALTQKELIYG